MEFAVDNINNDVELSSATVDCVVASVDKNAELLQILTETIVEKLRFTSSFQGFDWAIEKIYNE